MPYDGSNFVQEQNAAGAATATLLTGGVDQLFGRMTSAGISVPITDALGSVIGETNPAQSVTTSVAYEPYGTTTRSGTSTGNSQYYAGRENDGTGLYYNRARYYNPTMGRFISEDPIGFRGGTNIYAYVRGNPVTLNDPLGLIDVIAAGHIIEATATIVIGVGLAPVEVPLIVAAAAITGAYVAGEVIGELIDHSMEPQDPTTPPPPANNNAPPSTPKSCPN